VKRARKRVKRAKRKKATKRVLKGRKKRIPKKVKASSSAAESEPVGVMDLRQEVGVYTLSSEEESLLASRNRPKR
jgi:hypothetical protein